MRKAVASKVVNEVAQWGHTGHIDAPLLKTLMQRYDSGVTMGNLALRWLAFLAIFWLGMSILGTIGLVIGTVAIYIAPFVLAALGIAAWIFGVKLATEPSQRFATSGAVLVTVSFLFAFAAMAAGFEITGLEKWRVAIPVIMGLVALCAIATAYRFSLRWPLLIGLLFLFHAVGSRHGYWGHGAYFMGIRDEWLMLAVACISIGIGLWHERVVEKDEDHRHVGFGHVYLILGLLYANMSLWHLSIPGRDLFLVLLFAAAGVLQLVLGARLHDSRFTGFGIVFLAINMYTRMFEGFWDEMSKGLFFLVAGAIAMIASGLFEARARKLRPTE